MSTQTKFTSTVTDLTTLPALKHYDKSEIALNVDGFRKGEKNLFTILKLAVIGAVGYGLWVYVLPPVFQAIGQILAVAATGVFIVLGVVAAPVIFKWIKLFTRFLHKSLIKYDPFGQVEETRQKLISNQQLFRVGKMRISGLQNDMVNDSQKAEKDAQKAQEKILRLQAVGEDLKRRMDELVAKHGSEVKGEDEYVNYLAEFQKTMAEAVRVSNKLEQSKDFVQKYGSRAAVMKKLMQKLVMVEAAMEIKLADFDATVEMLKKDYEFGQKANQATTAAKSAMNFGSGWELDYAMEVITTTINADLAATAGNLRDIENIANSFTLDSDEMYSNLNTIADKIKVGQDVIPTTKQYLHPDYKLTQSDQAKSGGFGNMF